jgi:general stress protein YciG
MTESTETKKPKGFAAMTKEQRAEISRKGGRAAHARGTAHEFTAEEARRAGRKGGLATHAKHQDGG